MARTRDDTDLRTGGPSPVRDDHLSRSPQPAPNAARLTHARLAPNSRLAGERDARETLAHDGRAYHLRPSELQTLETVGMFRVVIERDLASDRHALSGHASADVESLRRQALLERVTVPINGKTTRVLVLTGTGKRLLEQRPNPQRQSYHAGLVKPRELAHDAQIYRAFSAEAARIEDRKGHIVRVVLDYEIKRDYQTFLNRPRSRTDRPSTEHVDTDLQAFAAANRLPVVDGHLEIPDLRIEYEEEDGRRGFRDVEVVTPHYSRGQMAGKRAAGFVLYRAARTNSRTGGTPYDPHHLERMR